MTRQTAKSLLMLGALLLLPACAGPRDQSTSSGSPAPNRTTAEIGALFDESGYMVTGRIHYATNGSVLELKDGTPMESTRSSIPLVAALTDGRHNEYDESGALISGFVKMDRTVLQFEKGRVVWSLDLDNPGAPPASMAPPAAYSQPTLPAPAPSYTCVSEPWYYAPGQGTVGAPVVQCDPY